MTFLRPFFVFQGLDPAGAIAFRATYPHTAFPGVGELSAVGLTSVGSCGSAVAPGATATAISQQDASVMGWCYGNTISSAQDAARVMASLTF